MIIENFNNNILGMLTESLEVKQEIQGLSVVKFVNTSYTVVGFNYILKDNTFVFDVDNKIYNNQIIINDVNINVGDMLICQYSY